MANRRLIILLLALVIVVAGCAAGANPMEGVADSDGRIAGFWLGLWHGFITPITFVISIFSDSVRFYATHNRGVLYDLAFLIGIGAVSRIVSIGVVFISDLFD